MSEKTAKLGIPISVVGVYDPGKIYYYYDSGIDLYIQEIHFDSHVVNTDFNDKSQFAQEAPGTLKKVYKGGKKVFEFAKDLIP